MRTTAFIAILLSVTVAAFGQKTDYATLYKGGVAGQLSGKPLGFASSIYTLSDTTSFPLQVFSEGKKVATFKTPDSFTITDSLGAIKELAKFYFGLKPTVVHKPDTVQVQVPFPVYLYDITDTVKVRVMYKKSDKSDRIYQTDGFALVRGFKTMQNGQPVWVDKPQLIGALDSKKKPIKNPIQVL
jgi:hypothetical protein